MKIDIGTLRRRLFIPINHEWNGIVRGITAEYEYDKKVDVELVCDAMARFYKNRATIARMMREWREVLK